MEKLEVILSLAVTALGLLATTITFTIKFIAAVKAKTKELKKKNLFDALVTFIQEAEKFVCSTGAEKKEIAINKAMAFAAANGIDFPLDEVSEKIESLIAMSKQVNAPAKNTK